MNVNRAVPPEGKVAYYKPDGTGRDTYIKQINGGLLSKDRLHSLNQLKPVKQRNFTFGKNQYNRHPNSYKSSKMNRFPHYISDGSGRDFYVTSNEGGNSVPFRWRDQTDYLFKSTLRSHAAFRNTNPEKQDVFAKSQMRSTMRESNFQKTFAPVQRQLDSRLSQPKKVHTPPPVYTYYGHKFNTTRASRMCETDFRKSDHSANDNCAHRSYY